MGQGHVCANALPPIDLGSPNLSQFPQFFPVPLIHPRAMISRRHLLTLPLSTSRDLGVSTMTHWVHISNEFARQSSAHCVTPCVTVWPCVQTCVTQRHSPSHLDLLPMKEAHARSPPTSQYSRTPACRVVEVYCLLKTMLYYSRVIWAFRMAQ